MTTPTLARTPLDRDAIARQVFDAAICNPRLTLFDGLHSWIKLLEGLGGYLANSASVFEDGNNRLPPESEQVQAIGDAIERAAKIAGALTEAIEGGAA